MHSKALGIQQRKYGVFNIIFNVGGMTKVHKCTLVIPPVDSYSQLDFSLFSFQDRITMYHMMHRRYE